MYQLMETGRGDGRWGGSYGTATLNLVSSFPLFTHQSKV